MKAKPMARKDAPKKAGRRPLDIDPAQVEALARIDCTTPEIAAVVGCSEDTLERRFAGNLEKGRREGRASLRRMQYKLAMDGNATMLIWLGKMQLGQRETVRQEHSGVDGAPQKIIVEYADTTTADE